MQNKINAEEIKIKKDYYNNQLKQKQSKFEEINTRLQKLVRKYGDQEEFYQRKSAFEPNRMKLGTSPEYELLDAYEEMNKINQQNVEIQKNFKDQVDANGVKLKQGFEQNKEIKSKAQ